MGILEIDSVELSFKSRRVLQNVYLKLSVGQVTAILGRNGCGKSCLLQVLFGTLEAQNKSVRWNGQYLESPYKKTAIIRYLPQYPFTPNALKIQDAFRLYQSDFEQLVSQCPNLARYYKTPFGLLSGGERRFIETALVLFSKTQFVLLDEPFSFLSPIYVAILQQMMAQQQQHKGILLTDHLYREVLKIADQTYLLQNGVTTLLKNPKQELINRGYLPDLQ